ncbi:hypothetical protein D3C87_1619050 [compost metagenome]
MRPGNIGACRQGLQIGKEIADILRRHAHIGAIGERRIEMLAIRPDAAGHGIAELSQRPAADTDIRIGRNIGNMEGAEWAWQRPPAGHDLQRIAFGPGCSMAAGASAGPEQLLAMGQIRRAGIRPEAFRMRLRFCQRPCGDGSQTYYRDANRRYLRPGRGHGKSPEIRSSGS